MKKKIFMSVSALAVVALSALTGYNAQSSETTVADLMLKENIEALADNTGRQTSFEGEISLGKKHKGYRTWETTGAPENEKAFYDCKGILRYGYNPKYDCE